MSIAFLALMIVAGAATGAFAISRLIHVSSTGVDQPGCDPCETLFKALSELGPDGGEIVCLDAVYNSSIVIAYSVTIDCSAAHAVIHSSGGAAVEVSGTATVVQLKGVDIDCNLSFGCTYGIRFLNGGSLALDGVAIRSGRNGGIDFRAPGGAMTLRNVTIDNSRDANAIAVVVAPTSGNGKVSIDNSSFDHNPYGIAVLDAGNIQLSVSNTTLSNSTAYGILISPTGGAHKIDISDSRIVNSATSGILMAQSAPAVQLSLSNTTVSNATGNGVLVNPSAGTTKLTVKDSQVVNNGGNGLMLAPTGAAKVNTTVISSAFDGNVIGIRSFPASQAVSNLSISDTSASNNAGGIHASGKSTVGIIRANIGGNTSYGVAAVSPAAIRIGSSMINGNASGLSGPISSYGNNQFLGNNTQGSSTPVAPADVP